MSKRSRTSIGIVLLLMGLVLAAIVLWRQMYPPAEPTPPSTPEATASHTEEPVPESSSEPVATTEPDDGSVDGLPVGKLVITDERKAYVDGSLSIYIPVINITRTIYDGTDNATLKKGVGLYEYAQLPGQGNRNVSMAGHRNGLSNGQITDHAPFYYIDKVGEGDYLYLRDGEHIYRYLWESCTVVEPDDWSPIYTTGYSCLTITSCTPIGVSDHRIVVRAGLDKIFDYDKDFVYLEKEQES